MKTCTFVAFLVLNVFLLTTAGAVPKGRVLTWKSTEGTVVFEGKSHAGKGLKCKDCHKGLFKRKHGTAAMSMKDLNEGNHCGACHNGKLAFDTTSETNCTKCHSGK
jgi:c(7)-type cytochrome triheme protein